MLGKTIKTFLFLAAFLVMAVPSFGMGATPIVMFDQGHNQRFLVEDSGDLQLSGLAEAIRAQGGQVLATKEVLTDETLKGVTALVISGPFEPLKPAEVDAIVRFVENGGRLAAMLHIAPPLAGLLTRLDVDYSNGVLHEQQNIIDKDLNFRVQDLSANPLFRDLKGFSAYGAWALNAGAAATVIARTSKDAWVDLNADNVLSRGDAVGAFGVVATGNLGKGSFLVFGDDAIFQNRYLVDSNKKLADNLGVWLSGN